METPPIIPDEASRLAALQALDLLDTAGSDLFDRLTKEAARLLQTPVALISLVDADRQWFYARVGLDAAQTPRSVSFCGHAVAADRPLIVNDATLDKRFFDNPLVTGSPNIKAYLGVPVHAPGGQAIGTLCVIDSRVREFTTKDEQVLRRLTQLIELMLARRSRR